MLIMGWIVSIPVFCDSGFVILNPIRKALVSARAYPRLPPPSASRSVLHIPLLYPPTPGPIAAADTLGGADGC